MHLYWAKATCERPGAVVTHRETFFKVDVNTFFVKFPVRCDEIFKYTWKMLQHVCKKCPIFENVTDLRYWKQKQKIINVSETFTVWFAKFKWCTGSCFVQYTHGQSRTWHKEQLVSNRKQWWSNCMTSYAVTKLRRIIWIPMVVHTELSTKFQNVHFERGPNFRVNSYQCILPVLRDVSSQWLRPCSRD